MQMLPFPILQNITGSEPGLKSLSGKGNNDEQGFDNILKGILGSTTQNMGFSQALAPDLEKISIFNLNMLNAIIDIIKKLSKEINENQQVIDLSNFQDILEKALTEDETSFLEYILQKNFSVLGGEEGIQFDLLNDDSKGPVLEAIKKAILALNGLIEQINRAESSLFSKQGTQISQELSQGEVSKNPTLQLLVALKDKLEQIHSGLKDTGDSVTESSKSGKMPSQKESQISEKSDNTGQKQELEDSNEPVKRVNQLLQQKQGLKKSVSSGPKPSENLKLNNGLTGLSKAVNVNGKQKSMSSTGQDSFLFNKESGSKNTVNLSPNLYKEIKNETLDKLLDKLNLSAKTDAKVIVDNTAHQLKFRNHLLRDNGKGSNSKGSLLTENVLKIEETTSVLSQTTKGEILHSTTPKQYINSSYIIDQITEKIYIGVSRGRSRISIQLHPPSLGKLQIDLSMNQNQLRAVIIAESSQVKQILESNLNQLRACLESQNIEVDKFSVSVGQENKQSASFFKDQNGKEKKGISVQAVTEQVKPGLHEEQVNSMIPVIMDTGRDILDIFV